jgi:hypothetical protein
MTEENTPAQKPSAFEEIMRYFTFALVTATGYMCYQVFEFVMSRSAKEKLDATSLESTYNSLIFSFAAWAIMFFINGAWLGIKKHQVGLMRLGIGVAGIAMASTIAVLAHRTFVPGFQ